MSDSKKPQYARVEQPFGCEPPIMHCPICGQAMVKVSEDEASITPCPHLEFYYIGAANEFGFVTDEFQCKLDENENDSSDCECFDDEEEFEELLCKFGYDNMLLAIEITHGGMACTPVYYTDVIGFNFGRIHSPAQD